MNNKTYKYHHTGLITLSPKENEEYNEEMKFYASGYFQSQYGIEWLRFEKESPLHPLIKTVPHVAFVVENINEAIKGKKVIYGPESNTEGVIVCFIEKNGAPVEFLQFAKPEEEIWPNKAKLINNSLIETTCENTYEYHHFGISTNQEKENEIYLNKFNLYCTNHENNPFGLQWMRYEQISSLPDLVKNVSHAAFQVKNLEKAIKGKKVIIEPNSPSKGVLVAFVEENGAPIEFLQIDKT